MEQEATLSLRSAMDMELVIFTVNINMKWRMFFDIIYHFLFHFQENSDMIFFFLISLVLCVQDLDILMQGNRSNLVSIFVFS